MGDLTAVKREPHGGAVTRALRLVTLSLILAVFAAFAAHHAESLFAVSHADAPVGHVAVAAEEAPVLEALSQSAFGNDADILQIIGFGCTALLLCGLFGALVRAVVPSEKQARDSGGRVARAVALLGAVSSRITPPPSLTELSISRT